MRARCVDLNRLSGDLHFLGDLADGQSDVQHFGGVYVENDPGLAESVEAGLADLQIVSTRLKVDKRIEAFRIGFTFFNDAGGWILHLDTGPRNHSAAGVRNNAGNACVHFGMQRAVQRTHSGH